MEFNIDREDIKIPDVCPLLGTPLTVLNARKGGSLINRASVDRIDNNLGYVKGNIRVISARANILKNSIDLALAEKLVAYIKGDI